MRWLICSALASGAIGLLFATIRASDIALRSVVPEPDSGLEPVQPYLWALSAALATIATARQPTNRGLLLALWLGAISTLAGLRELDLHAVLNPDNIHLIGLDPAHAVRFRLDWWLSSSPATISARIAWGTILLALGALLILPFALARYPWPSALLARRAFAVTVASGFALLAAGYAIDDLIARDIERWSRLATHLEESLEFLGQLALLCAIAALALQRVDLTAPGITASPDAPHRPTRHPAEPRGTTAPGRSSAAPPGPPSPSRSEPRARSGPDRDHRS